MVMSSDADSSIVGKPWISAFQFATFGWILTSRRYLNIDFESTAKNSAFGEKLRLRRKSTPSAESAPPAKFQNPLRKYAKFRPAETFWFFWVFLVVFGFFWVYFGFSGFFEIWVFIVIGNLRLQWYFIPSFSLPSLFQGTRRGDRQQKTDRQNTRIMYNAA